MRFQTFIFIFLFVFGFSASSFSETITCNSFKGSQISVDGSRIKNVDDGYSGQTIKLHLNGDNSEVEWAGPNRFRVKIIPAGMSEVEGWLMFVQFHPEVYRTYMYFFKSGHLAFTESQAQIMTGVPSIKSMLGRCN